MDIRVKILVLETNPTDVELVSMQMRKASLQATVQRAGSLEMLLDAAREVQPDCVLANLAIPRLDVAEAIEASRKIVPRLPWVIYALNGNEETAVHCMKAGAADFVLKRHITRLGQSVRDAIEKSAAAPEAKTEEEPSPRGGEAAPQETKGIFQRLVESSPDLIAVVNLDGRREYNNPAYTRVLEDPDVLAGTDSFLDILEEDRERIRLLFQEIVRRGYGERTEYRLMDKDGDTRYIQSNSGMILNEEGDPEKIVVISRDITDMVRERMRVENLFAATAGVGEAEFFPVMVHRLAEALGVRSVFVTMVTGDGGNRVRTLAVWAENRLQPEFEYDVQGSPCERVVLHGETVLHEKGVRAAFPDLSLPLAVRSEGYLGTPLQGPDGKVLGHLAAFDDTPIVEMARKEFLLRAIAQRASLELTRLLAPRAVREEAKEEGDAPSDMEARMRTGVEGLPFPVVMTNDLGMITLVNPHLEELCGMKAEDLIGRRAWPLILRGGPWHLLKEEYEDTVIRLDRTPVTVSVYAIPCRNSEGRISGTMGILRAL